MRGAAPSPHTLRRRALLSGDAAEIEPLWMTPAAIAAAQAQAEAS